jgi:PST family polysaccharide transporter
MDIAGIRERSIKGSAALFMRHVVGFSINFVGGVILARTLGPQTWGAYSVALFAFVCAESILRYGLSAYLIRKPEELTLLEIRVTATLQQVLGVIIGGVTLLAAYPISIWYHKESLYFLFIALAINNWIYSWRSLPLSLLERRLEYAKLGIIEVVDILAFNSCAVAGALLNRSVQGIALGFVLRGLVSTIISYNFAGVNPSMAWNRKVAQNLVAFGIPFSISNFILNVSIYLAPPVLVGSLLGFKVLGFTQLALSLMASFSVLSSVIVRLSFSPLSRIQQDQKLFGIVVGKVTSVTSFIVFPMLVVLVGLSPYYIPLIYGEQWTAVSDIMIVSCLAYTLVPLWSVGAALWAIGEAKLMFTLNGLLSVLYWALSAWLIPRLGYLGLPLALSISHAIVFALIIYNYNRFFKGSINLKELFVKIMVVVGIMVIFWVIRRESLWFFIGIIAAFLMLWFKAYVSQGRFIYDAVFSMWSNKKVPVD